MNEHSKIKNRKLYYREKVMKLNEKLFLETGDARSRICNCDEKIESAYMASKEIGLPPEIDKLWNKYWEELNVGEKDLVFNRRDQMIGTPICTTVSRKRKYL